MKRAELLKHTTCDVCHQKIGISADNVEAQIAYRERATRELGELKGKHLACWCALDKPCHADVLLRLKHRTTTARTAGTTPGGFMHPDTPSLQLPAAAGTPFEGGFYVGRIRVGDDLYALIVSPKTEGDAEGGVWGKYGQAVPGARSFCDGLANTLAMAEAGSAIAQAALKLEINGYTDWYIPSRDELELLYRHLKPTTDENYRWRGDNPSSVPPGYCYEEQSPAQTSVAAFQEGGAEALEEAWYWSSTQGSARGAWSQFASNGRQYTFDESDTGRVRAVRRFKLTP